MASGGDEVDGMGWQGWETVLRVYVATSSSKSEADGVLYHLRRMQRAVARNADTSSFLHLNLHDVASHCGSGGSDCSPWTLQTLPDKISFVQGVKYKFWRSLLGQGNNAELDNSTHVWLPDCDMRFSEVDLPAMVQDMMRAGVAIAQPIPYGPGNGRYANGSLPAAWKCNECILCRITSVEVKLALFTAPAFRAVHRRLLEPLPPRHLLQEEGIDLFWCKVAEVELSYLTGTACALLLRHRLYHFDTKSILRNNHTHFKRLSGVYNNLHVGGFAQMPSWRPGGKTNLERCVDVRHSSAS